MGISIMEGGAPSQAVMFDDTRDWSLGPIVGDCEGCDATAAKVLEDFLAYASEDRECRDIRLLSYADLYDLWTDYMIDRHTHA